MDRRNGGSLNEWVGTIEKLLEIDFDAAIPRHGPVLTKDQVRTFHRNLIALRQRLIAR